MAETSVYTTVLSLLAELSGSEELQPDTRLKDDLALDSIEIVQLVLRLNTAFGLRIHSAEILPEHFGTVSQLVRFLEGK
ncbi:MAG: acyl carrier protein, partial [Candidatus Sericytochromatia bacterium]